MGDATAIPARDASYDAVVDFGIIHHIPAWRDALVEVHRVLRQGGRFYAEEMLRAFIVAPVVRQLFDHPLNDRCDAAEFMAAIEASRMTILSSSAIGGSMAWVVAEKPGQSASAPGL